MIDHSDQSYAGVWYNRDHGLIFIILVKYWCTTWMNCNLIQISAAILRQLLKIANILFSAPQSSKATYKLRTAKHRLEPIFSFPRADPGIGIKDNQMKLIRSTVDGSASDRPEHQLCSEQRSSSPRLGQQPIGAQPHLAREQRGCEEQKVVRGPADGQRSKDWSVLRGTTGEFNMTRSVPYRRAWNLP